MGTKFQGLAGDFHLVSGQLQASVFEIVNVNGDRGREVGFWTPENGLLKSLRSANGTTAYSTSNANLRPVIWPGDTTYIPKGWEIPTSGKKLRILVPVKDGFSQFVKVTKDPTTNATLVTGYSIDIFSAVMQELPYYVPYKFIPFAKPDGESAGTYNNLIDQVHNQASTVFSILPNL